MKSTHTPSQGEDLSRAQERSQVLALETIVHDLIALERARIESRERLELASMEEARALSEERLRRLDALTQGLPGLLTLLAKVTGASVVQTGSIPGHDVKRAPTAEPAPAPAPASSEELDDDVDASPAERPPTSEVKSEPSPVLPPVANGVSAGHPLAHLYGEQH